MKKISNYNYSDMALVLLNPRCACKFRKTYTMSLYQGDNEKSVITCNPKSIPLEVLDKMIICKVS